MFTSNPISNLRKSVILFFLSLAVAPLAGQTTLYSETFTNQEGKGFTGPSTTDLNGVSWTLDVSGGTYNDANDYFKVDNGELEARDLGGESIWYSDTVDINGYTNVTFSFDLREEGDIENSDYVNVEYSTNNGATYTRVVRQPYQFTYTGDTILSGGNYIYDDADFSTAANNTINVSESGLSGSSFILKITLRNNSSSEYMMVDNVSIQGTAAGPTTWNGSSWSNGAPDANTDAVIDGNVAPGSFTCKDLTINSSRALVFGTNQTVTVSGTSVTNNGFGFIAADASGSVVFDNDGNTITLSGNNHSFRGVITVSGTTALKTNGLITLTAPSPSSSGQLTGTGTVNDAISMQAFLDASTGRYFYLGSPFTDATLSDFNEPASTMVSSNSSQGTAWEWDAANAEWDPAGTAAGTGLSATATRGRGYAMYAGMNGSFGPFLIDDGDRTGTVTITGTINNDATVSTPLSYNDGQASSMSFVGGSGVSATEGWNLVANPYAAIYDWDGQTIPTDMSSAIYRFNGTNYTSYAKGAGTASRYIAPMQAFFVQLTANTPGNLTFDRDNRVTGQSATLAKTAHYTVDFAALHIEGLAGDVYDDVYIGFQSSSTIGFDKDWDARKLLNRGNAPNFYVSFGPDAYSICRVPFTGPRSFPLSLDYKQDGDAMTITLDQSRLQSFGKVYLEDRKLGTMHDLSLGHYNFIQDNTYGPNRFIVHFSQPTIGVEEPQEQAVVYGYVNDEGLHVDLGILHNASVEIYNLAGQLIERGNELNGRASFAVEQSGLYIVKVEAGNFTKSLKVIR